MFYLFPRKEFGLKAHFLAAGPSCVIAPSTKAAALCPLDGCGHYQWK
jgi:hypothetical protein